MKNREFQKLARYWQRRLKLQDWDVTFHLCRAKEINKRAKSPVDGLCEFKEQLKKSDIFIFNQKDRDELESTLCHELLHLHFWFVDRVRDDVLLEQAIESTAQAFIYDNPSTEE